MSGSNLAADGVTTIEAGTPLTRLHFFDGKFLRADALSLEQDYHRELVRLANLAGGWGVVNGFGIGTVGASLAVTPGLAITPAGRIVLLTQPIELEIAALIATAQVPVAATGQPGFGDCEPGTATGPAETAGQGIYEITIGPAQALCGNEEVFGKLCEDACITDTQRPYWREGMVLRLRPITLTLPDSTAVTLGATHLRNRVASAYFAHEPWLTASLLSAQGLGSGTWCNPALLHGREEVPIGLLVREGSALRVLDAWSARRERMEAQARGYWQGRMRMRPWNVFLAQILQFQCQLSGLFQKGSPVFEPQPDDECAQLRRLLPDSIAELQAARQAYAEGDAGIRKLLGMNATPETQGALGALEAPTKRIEALAKKLGDAQGSLTPVTPNRLLLNGGFAELPPAAYLPVIPGQSPVNLQLQRMFGEGVNLTLCAAPTDHLAHLLEEAQHMDRISLTRGLDDPAAKEAVEVFVPDGVILGSAEAAGGVQWFAQLDPAVLAAVFSPARFQEQQQPPPPPAPQDRVAAATQPDQAAAAGATPFALLHSILTTGQVGAAEAAVATRFTGVARSTIIGSNGGNIAMVVRPDPNANSSVVGIYLEMQMDSDPFAAAEGDEIATSLRTPGRPPGDDRPEQHAGGVVQNGDGRLTVGPAYQASAGLAGLRVTLKLLTNITVIGGGGSGSGGTTTEQTGTAFFDLALSRQGNAAAGLQRFEPRNTIATAAGSARPSWEADWGGTPRHATFERINIAPTECDDAAGRPARDPLARARGAGPAEGARYPRAHRRCDRGYRLRRARQAAAVSRCGGHARGAAAPRDEGLGVVPPTAPGALHRADGARAGRHRGLPDAACRAQG